MAVADDYIEQMRRFKGMVRRGLEPGSLVLRKPIVSVVENQPTETRRVLYTISTAAIDREKDSIRQDGWVLDAYLTNPVVLWGHRSTDLPIGRCVDIDLSTGSLRAMVEYVPADMPEVGAKAEAVLRMSRTGFLSATSVGFRPLKFEVATDRDDEDSWWPPVNFLSQELMEFSVVSIPANPEALIDPAERVQAGVEATADEIRIAVEAAAEAAAAATRSATTAAQAEIARLATISANRKRRQLEARLIEIGS